MANQSFFRIVSELSSYSKTQTKQENDIFEMEREILR